MSRLLGKCSQGFLTFLNAFMLRIFYDLLGPDWLSKISSGEVSGTIYSSANSKSNADLG